MKIAVCYSGSIRIFLDVIDTHIKHLLSLYDCDVFLDTWDVYGNGGHKLKYESSQDDLITGSDKSIILEKLKPVNYIFEKYDEMEKFFIEEEKKYYEGHPYARNILSMFYKIKNCNEMVINQNKNYDVVLRLRCDHVFIDNFTPEFLEDNTLYANELGSWSETIVNDQFFYSKQEVMNQVCKTYDKLPIFFERGIKRTAPEHLFYLSLKEDNINIIKKPFNYYILKRAKGQEYH